jgi:UDP-glucose 4-epimerase
MSRILITGGAGMIGSETSKMLSENGYKVRIIDLPEEVKKLKKDIILDKNIEIFRGSILNQNFLNKCTKNVDVIYHLAAKLGVKKTERFKKDCLDVNIFGTANVLKAAVKNKVKRIIFASSSEVYGEPLRNPISENDSTQGKTIYGVSKLAGEELCKAYYKKYKINYTILRYFNTYSEKQNKEFVISKFSNLIKKNKKVIINGSGTQIRSYTYAKDTAFANMLVLRKKNTKNNIFNIGNSKEPVTIFKLAQIIAKLMKKKLKVKFDKEFVKTDRSKKREIYKRYCSGKKAKKVLGWEPKIKLEEGIKKFI